MLIRQFRVEGLGHLSTLIADDSAGVAAGVDPATIGNIEARRVTPHRLTWAALMAVVGAPEEDGTPAVPSSWRAQRRARE